MRAAAYTHTSSTTFQQSLKISSLSNLYCASNARGPEARELRTLCEKISFKEYERATIATIENPSGNETLAYNHVSPKPLFSTVCRYNYVGRIKPRRFLVNE